MNNKKFHEMVARKAVLESRIKAIKEHQRRSSVSYLIEAALEKAEAALTAQAITDIFSKMAEDAAKIEGDKLMPLMDSLKASFGPEMAQSFQAAVSEQTRNAVQSLSQIKDAVSAAVSKLEAVANGQAPANDMANDDMGAPPMAPGADDMSAPMGDAPPAEDDISNMAGADAGGDDFFADEPAGPAGRPTKESRTRRGKPLKEGLLDQIKTVLTAHFDEVEADRSPREQLEALKPFITASDYEVASQFNDALLGSIFDRTDAAVGMDGPGLAGDIPTTEIIKQTGGAMGLGLNDGPKPSELGATVANDTGMTGMDAPAIPALADDGMDDDMDTDLHGEMGSPLDMPFESRKSPARRLRESKDPDGMIFTLFNRVVAEGVVRKTAARKVAETFGLDLSDVVTVIREAETFRQVAVEKAKPGRDWKRIYVEGRKDGLTKSALVTLISESSVDKRDPSVIRAWMAESEKQDAIFGKKGDKKDDKKGKDCKGDDCEVSAEEKSKTGKPWDKKVDEAFNVKKDTSGKHSGRHVVRDDEDGDKYAGDFTRGRDARNVADQLNKHKASKAPKPEQVEERWELPKKSGETGKKISADRHLMRKIEAGEKAKAAEKAKKSEKPVSEDADAPIVQAFNRMTRKSVPGTAARSIELSTALLKDKLKAKNELDTLEDYIFPRMRREVTESEGDVGFQAAISTPMKYPEASAPAFRSNSGKGGKGTDSSEKPMVVGGKINPTKGNPAQAGKMAGQKVEESEGDTGFPTASNKDKGFPEATNPAFRSNSGKGGKGTDKAGKSLVTGGSEPKGTAKTAGKMAEAASVKKK